MVESKDQTSALHRASLVCLAAAGVLALLLALTATPQPAQGQTPESSSTPGAPASPARIAVVADAGPEADSLADRFREELSSLMEARREVAVNVVRPASSKRVTRALQTSDPDAVVAVGPVAAAMLCTETTESGALADQLDGRPLVSVSTGSGLLAPEDGSACTAVGPRGWPSESFRAFQRLTRFDRVAVVVDAGVAESVGGADERVRRLGEQAGTSARLVAAQPGDVSADQVEGDGTTAVFLDHVDQWAPAEVRSLTQSLARQSVPVFAYDPAHVEHHGALAAPDVIERMRARRAALAVETSLTGTPRPAGKALPARADTQKSDGPEADTASPQAVVVNRSVAEKQNVSLPWSLRIDARLVDAPAGGASDAEAMTLAASMQQSIRANLQLQAKQQSTDAAANNVDLARSRLLPQVNVSATGQTVSEDVAQSSFGSQPERELSSSVSFRQVIFNEPAFAELSVERRMQAMREFERQTTRLDAAESAADAYVQVLQARAGVKIQRENVRVVRANLSAAESRRAAGKANPREVSRLETQLARAEQGLLRALGRERAAEIQYNRVLDRPLDAPVRLDQTTGVDPRPVLEQFPYADLFAEAQQTTAFRRFWVKEARTQAPRVQAVDRLVSARERQLTSANRSFWMPTLAVEGAYSQRMAEGGSGTSGLDLQLPGGGGSPSIPSPPDEQWSLSLTASFPLFNGAERAARQRQTSDQLAASRTQRQITETRVEQSVRTALVNLETSYEAVRRALRAADAAQRTLDVTQAAYRQGTATLVDLIDAQSTALATRQEASDAAYGLIRDWISVQRAAGSFRVLRTPQEQDAFEERLQSFLPPKLRDEAER
jgi:outer membrane protein TolC